jgi:hypothetical protein
MRNRIIHSAFAAMLLWIGTGCRHQVATVVTSASLSEEYCWWAVMRSPLIQDSVADHFAKAFAVAGMVGIERKRLGDTSWVSTMLSPIAPGASRLYSSRVVAYQSGDSTHFRQFVSVARDINAIGLCGELARSAAVHAIAPREPTGEEKLPVWTRVP